MAFRHWPIQVVGAAIAATFLAIQALRALRQIALPFTNEDNALIWAAAVDYGNLEFRQPNSWGQFYIAIVEAAPTWLLMTLGAHPGTALMVTITVLATAGWVALAIAAIVRREWTLATLAFGIPVVLGLQYAAFAQTYGAQAGRTLAAAAVALLLVRRRASGARLAVFVFCAGLCLAWLDPSTGILLAPVLVWLALRRDWRRRWPAAVIGAVPAGVIALGIRVFNARHPEYEVHPRPRTTPSVSQFMTNVEALPDALALYAPANRVTGVLVAVGLVLIAVAVRRSRSLPVVGAALTFAVVFVVAFATPSITDGFGEPFFPWGRTLMSMPAAVWFIAFVAITAVPDARRGRRLRSLLLAVTALAVLTATYSNVLGFNRTADALASAGLTQRLVVRNTVESIDRRCDGLAESAGLAGADVVAIYAESDRALAYACPVLHPGLTAVFPPYERRVWILKEQAARPEPSRFLLIGVGGEPCAAFPKVTCVPVGGPAPGWLVESPLPMPQTLEALGLPVQAYRAP